MISDFKIFENIDSELLDKVYQKDNFIIEETNSKENLAVIYFSSNGIYFPNENDVLKENIISKNKFEWYKTRISRAKKHIFIRDVIKQFYAAGINEKINSIDKMINFLKEETKGMEIITVGSSAGGYMSILAGILLNADMIFAFSPIIDLDINSINAKCTEREKYLNTVDLIKTSNSFILYFMPAYSKDDVEQLSILEKNNINNILVYRYKSNIHGAALKRKEMFALINSSKEFLTFVYKYILKGTPSKKRMKYIFKLKYILKGFN